MKRLYCLLAFLSMLTSYALCSPTLHVAILWHQHQPFYKNAEAGNYVLPWVLLHSTKDYYDMVKLLEQFPDIHVTFNLTPVLLYQIADYCRGAVDRRVEVALKPVSELTEEEKIFVLRYFFDANWDRIIYRHRRYAKLLSKRGTDTSDRALRKALRRFSDQDILDLETLFFLAWIDPAIRASDPLLKGLWEKGEGFTEAEKRAVIDKMYEIVKKVIPAHREAAERGNVELITSPFFHPILPLLYDTTLAEITAEDITVAKFSRPEDARLQVSLAICYFERLFGRKPTGMWPPEGAVSLEIVPILADVGIKYIVSDERVLENSIFEEGFKGIIRDSRGVPLNPEYLCRPYLVESEGRKIFVFFRDHVLSDRISFMYAGLDAKAAVEDFISYLRAVRSRLKGKGPYVLVVALDGENCWEWYENDGIDFLKELYKRLSSEPGIKTVTLSEALKLFEEKGGYGHLVDLVPGSWVDGTLATWIGEDEENRAWELLSAVRNKLEGYGEIPSPAEILDGRTPLARAYFEVMAAEGSDWFWWYGSDQNSGHDDVFDELFRGHIKSACRILGLKPPQRAFIPIVVRAPERPKRDMSGFTMPKIDGDVSSEEQTCAIWEAPFGALYVGLCRKGLYVAARTDRKAVAVYFSSPGAPANATSRETGEVLGFDLSFELFAKLPSGRFEAFLADGKGGWLPFKDTGGLRYATKDGILEAFVPFELLGAKAHKKVMVCALFLEEAKASKLPTEGPATVTVPAKQIGELIAAVDDPAGDDYGPGTYVYPKNKVFVEGAFDLTRFEMYRDEGKGLLVFKLYFRNLGDNPWNSPRNFSLQTIDIYIDTGKEGGATQMLPGRYATIDREFAWERMIWVEGWLAEIVEPKGGGGFKERKDVVKAFGDPIENSITIVVPEKYIGKPSPEWGLTVAILSQEGFPKHGAWRVRDVHSVAGEWTLGGGDDYWADTNIIDLLWPQRGVQEAWLSDYEGRGTPDESRYRYAKVKGLRLKDIMVKK